MNTVDNYLFSPCLLQNTVPFVIIVDFALFFVSIDFREKNVVSVF